MTEEAMARGSDPISSHIAADAMEDSGRRAGHEGLILAGLTWLETPSKVKQLARVIDLTPIQISRRIAGMREQHLIHTRTGEGRNKEMRIHLGPDPDQPAKKRWTAPCSSEAEAVAILSTVSEYMEPILNVITTYAQEMGRYDMSKPEPETGWHYEVALTVVTALKAKLNNGMYLPDDIHKEKAWRS